MIPDLTALGPECRRLLHGRGGNFPGLEHVSIDWFSPVLLITFHADGEQNKALQGSLVEAATGIDEITAIVVQNRHLNGAPKDTIYGQIPESPVALESGLHYHLTLDRNQNHGFFPDMRPGRDWVRTQAHGKRVLNLFAYTCSLSVAAIAGGAESVVNLDMAGSSLATGRRNHQLNFDPSTCKRASYLPHDLFKTWGRLKRGAPYDLVIVDPPSNQAGSFVAEKDYARIARRLPEIIHPETRILACLNSPLLGESFLTDLFSTFQFEGRLPQAPGFEDREPQRGLKSLVFSS